MLLPPRQRELGPALHAAQWADLRRKFEGLIAWLDPREPGDPVSSGFGQRGSENRTVGAAP
jgi:hypothetical protein